MITFLTIVHVVNCLFLGVIVLLQHGKGADIGATFGGSSNTVFGARGAATLLSKMTAYSAILFMFTSISLAYFSASESSKSVFAGKNAPSKSEKTPVQTPTVAGTAVPGAAAATPVATTSPAVTTPPTKAPLVPDKASPSSK